MVEVFKTNVNSHDHALEIIHALQKVLPFAKINFDLEDCDKILRVEDEVIFVPQIIECLAGLAVMAALLE
jgi:hypothetical protein